MTENFKPLDREGMAKRLAQDIPEGWAVNLGIGIPLLVGGHIPKDREVLIHSENGLLGIGEFPKGDDVDPWLTNAGSMNVLLLKGASIVHHADSFAMVRGGHLNVCVLGAYEVAENGDVANWSTGPGDRLPAIGGAMDLASALPIWVVMEHTTKDGGPRLVEKVTYPLTAVNCVKRVYTNLAVIDVVPDKGFVVRDIIPGLSFESLQARSGAKLHQS